MNMRELQAALGLPADGVRGPVTTAEILNAADEGRLTAVARVPAPVTSPVPLQSDLPDWPRQSGVTAFYGTAGAPACTAGSVILPFPFVIAWDDSQRITRFSCHAKVATALIRIFGQAAAHYGEAEFRRLRLDQFGGCYNYRVMRGGTSLSMHAWGIAVDLDPINNQLSWGSDRAAFAKPAYDPFWKIVEAHGATSLGRRADRDFMHFQFASL